MKTILLSLLTLALATPALAERDDQAFDFNKPKKEKKQEPVADAVPQTEEELSGYEYDPEAPGDKYMLMNADGSARVVTLKEGTMEFIYSLTAQTLKRFDFSDLEMSEKFNEEQVKKFISTLMTEDYCLKDYNEVPAGMPFCGGSVAEKYVFSLIRVEGNSVVIEMREFY